MNQMKFRYEIAGMRCNSCVQKIYEVLSLAGFQNAKVLLNPPELAFQSERQVAETEIQRLLSSAGSYKVQRQLGEAEESAVPSNSAASTDSLLPLGIIVSYILGGVLLRAFLAGDFSLHSLMGNFMGAFFVVFSLFKLINLRGFAQAYRSYDLIAQRFPSYGLFYPFLELMLGIAYFVDAFPFFINAFTCALMVVGAIGVYGKLKEGAQIQCACLGTALRLPMTKVTLVEDLGMALMALLMMALG